jgi:hypothetical protein
MAGIAVFGERLGVPALSLLVLIATISSNKPAPSAIGAVLGEQCSLDNSAGILLGDRAQNGPVEDYGLCLEHRRGQSWRGGIHQHRAG